MLDGLNGSEDDRRHRGGRHVSGVAEKMGYVQSNVTARIRKLESELGVPLFDRHPKGVTPTEKGLVLYRYAKEILDMTEEAVAAVKEPPYPCGPLVIGVVETMATSPSFIQALSHFQRTYPEVALSLVSGTSPQHYEGMLSRRLDGAFITGDYDMSPLVSELEIREEVSSPLRRRNPKKRGIQGIRTNGCFLDRISQGMSVPEV